MSAVIESGERRCEGEEFGTSAGEMKANAIEQVVVHPLVLLSIVDHYNRVAKDTHKRVVGVLLGETSGGRVDVTNSYAGTSRATQTE